MLDPAKIDDYCKLLEAQQELGRQYLEARTSASEARISLYFILTQHLPTLRRNKRNIGIEMAELMLLEEGYLDEPQRAECIDYWATYQRGTDKYKSIEKLMEANNTKIMFIMSLAKWQNTGEKYGS